MSHTDHYTLVSVNKNPERARRIITRVLEEVKEKYKIKYVANSPTIEGLPQILLDTQPDILFCASTWTPTESREIVEISQKTVPGIKSHITPIGLVDRDGEGAMVGHLKSIIEVMLAENFVE